MMMTRVFSTTAAVALAALLFGAAPASAEDGHGGPIPGRVNWSFAGTFGRFDTAQLQRGFQVYKEVCSSCHSMKLVAFRNLAQEGGPHFSAAQVKALAATYQVKDGPNDSGEMFDRPGRPADTFPPPFPNDQAAAAANGGKAPPDFSVIAKARTYSRGSLYFLTDWLPFVGYSEHGPDYIHALLNGYEEPPKDFSVPDGGHYNKYYPGHIIAMPPPITDGQVTYAKGEDGQPVVPETVDQYAKDVSAFLMWAAEPHMMDRKALGFRVILFLIVMSGLLYYVKKKIWADVGGEVHGLQPELHKTF
ncbi:cytochrome c1 [Methylobacterium sp. ARG-1]|uniref:cytochrome c1 n=1 Tax=Methylobacterium sp. ARG-1 TaxID=1692501 RepID=UPI0006808C94|nr:cytochrome c1 [Methylobacterium sp. ARG-1]KNY23578.1 cytochrome C [Methylobacterium sp. ARG-1]